MNLYEYARSTEQSGMACYRKLADRADDAGVKRIFNMLAEDEQRLLEKIDLIRERFPELAETECRGLAADRNPFETLCVKTDPEQVHSDLEAYELGKKLEQALIEHYRAISRDAPERAARLISWLISLEKKELAEIEALFDFANAPTNSLEWGEFSNLDEFHNFGRYEDLREDDLDLPTLPEKD